MNKKKSKKISRILRKYFFYFVIFSLVGSLIEWAFKGGQGISYDQGIYFLFGIKLLFIPFYGLGGLILIFFERFLEKEKIKFIYQGFLDGVIIVTWELIGGLFTLLVLHQRFWNYSSQPFNFMGIISLKMFLVWIAIGYVFSLIYKYIIGHHFKIKWKIS
ncbi:Putative ABC-transporter type IV [uncultured archaeon]|nr:Putative ABC-transporter type IV [uncultured archaeon]